MPSYFVTQPNGRYALWSTVVDHFTATEYTEADCMDWYRENGCKVSDIDRNWRRVLDDVIPLAEDKPCCDQKPLRRWHDCLNTILHVHGTAALADFLSAYSETYATPEHVGSAAP